MTRRLSLVLHTHMPYVEGFGTWPFGEEWLWEAIATCYVPLLDVLDAHPGRVTLSITPVLADQIEAPGVLDRYHAFLTDVREASHALDLEAHPEVRRAARALAGALPPRRGADDLLERFARHVDVDELRHPRDPPAAGDGVGHRPAGAHRRRRAPRALRRAARASGCPSARTRRGSSRTSSGVTCVELPGVVRGGRADWRRAGRWRRFDRGLIDLVWARDGYPSRRRLPRHPPLHRAPAPRVVGRRRSLRPGRRDASRREPTRRTSPLGCPDGWSVVAIDTELLGHWWAEGVDWLAALLETDLEIVPLTAEYGDGAAVTAAELPISSWGRDRDLSTWSGPTGAGARLAPARRRAAGLERSPPACGARAARAAVLGLGVPRRRGTTAGPYPLERAAAPRAAALAPAIGDARASRCWRNLAPAGTE